jgi:hypothetical protein
VPVPARVLAAGAARRRSGELAGAPLAREPAAPAADDEEENGKRKQGYNSLFTRG